MSIEKKRQNAKKRIIEKNGNNPHDPKCSRALRLIDSMVESNIPAGYWFVKMDGFEGPEILNKIVKLYISDICDSYNKGLSICLAGNQGTGKTMSSVCVLKAALKKDFSAYYITASDMMAEMTNYESNREIRKILRDSDFLVIDEVDSRFFPSDAQKELFSSIYENIFRYRTHNNLPTIICTNETQSILDVFYGHSIQAIGSLHKQYLKIYPIAGIDHRKRISNENVAG